jgi:hypothetical protein
VSMPKTWRTDTFMSGMSAGVWSVARMKASSSNLLGALAAGAEGGCLPYRRGLCRAILAKRDPAMCRAAVPPRPEGDPAGAP